MRTIERRRLHTEKLASVIIAVHGQRPSLLPRLYRDCYRLLKDAGQLASIKRISYRRLRQERLA